MTAARRGYTLPVFACAGAIAALRWLQEDLPTLSTVTLNLLEPAELAEIPIEQVARLSSTTALAVTRSDPGDNLDLTRDMAIWVWVEVGSSGLGSSGLGDSLPLILLEGGEGVGRQVNAADQPAIYAYARRLIEENLREYVSPGQTVRVRIVLPEGRSLAQRTSNAAFGVVEGLSLLGTSGISQPLSAPGQLEEFRETLRQKAEQFEGLVFCIGENGLDLAGKLGIEQRRLVKTANWLGPLLVEAGLLGVRSILLFGYHGKLIKLAGGIFHTHHHVADGRQEIFTAHCANLGLPNRDISIVLSSPTIEAALKHLRQLDEQMDGQAGRDWVSRVYAAIAQQVDVRSAAYIRTHTDRSVQVGCVMFDRDRRVIVQSEIGRTLFSQFC